MRYHMIVDTIVNCWKHTGIIDFDDNEEIEQGEEQITFETLLP